MRLLRLQVQHLRSLVEVKLELAPGINLFVGANGAGKTSLLEAAFLLSHGRSFRSGAKDALLQRGASSLSIFAELQGIDGQAHRLGLGREGGRWTARLDHAAVTVGDLVTHCAVTCFEPGSHALIAGGAEERRRYLDWGVFHVEHAFLSAWRRYQRALKQRNSLLRSLAGPADPGLFQPWEHELAQCAALIDVQRAHYLARLRPFLAASMGQLLPELGAVELRYRRGWPDDEALDDLLHAQRGRDLARGHTSQGAHRADWSVSFEQAPQREHLSRGQEKLVALGCVLAQASLYAELRGEWPVICLDDLASELDVAHQAAVVEHLRLAQAQVLLTGTEVPLAIGDTPATVFHVEQGQATPLL
ncbi:DNA recombination protein RecF [Frateuria sp. Soil773]|uniref:DNA replication/repair protein RecF n=1 Tax=Frateuria sp. Soil773 TaxID=1736407 RepID=UPI0006F3EEB9|nr:DNA replication/repair protein RecF [Frateuria sp. Soil773]KRF01220.1 DNA recombination protein RecF [Frateuria sp. Soil773]